MECSQLKRKYEKGFKEGVEISRKHDDPSVIIYKRKKCTDVLENDQKRDNKCQECVKLNWEIDDLKLRKKRDAAEIEDLRIKFMEMDIEVTVLSNHEIDLEKELEAYKIKCRDLSAELQWKGTELENLAVIKGGLDRQCEEYRAKCIGMEEKIKGLIEEGIVMSGIVMSERETSARERICLLEEVIKKMETNERGRFAELERKGLELENLRVVNGGLDREREDYGMKCIGMEEQIKGLKAVVMSQRDKSAGGRICHLEEAVNKMETDEVSCERTCWDMDGRVFAADEAHLTKTETSPNSTFTPCCKPFSRQVNSAGVKKIHKNNLNEDMSLSNSQCLTMLFDVVKSAEIIMHDMVHIMISMKYSEFSFKTI
ncbi:hypothetical protein MKW92_038117 [Papaver armeniacum]|nr:hypothetical protein MKW92_038117 [Papaver armeniacum]